MSSDMAEDSEIAVNESEPNDLPSTDDVSIVENSELVFNETEENKSSTGDVLDTNFAIHQTDEDNTEMEESEPVKDTDDTNADKEAVQKFTRLPLSKIRNIMKFDDDVTAASKEAIFLATKATELFIGDFAKEVYQCTLASKKKTISKRDVDAAIFNHDRFIFLDGTLS